MARIYLFAGVNLTNMIYGQVDRVHRFLGIVFRCIIAIDVLIEFVQLRRFE